MSSISYDIYKELGCGFEEPVYQKAFEVDLRLNGIYYENNKVVPVTYKGFNVGEQKLDLFITIEDKLIVELKAILALSPKETTQLQLYMRLLKINTGLLVNFPQVGTSKSKNDIPCEPEFKILPEL